MSHCGKCGLNRSYDVFGKLTSQSNELSGAHISHGYTGHEHDTEHGLIALLTWAGVFSVFMTTPLKGATYLNNLHRFICVI
jgi:hypothetical protein